MDDEQLRGMLDLANFTEEPAAALAEELERESREAPTVLRFVTSQRDGEIVERVISAAAAGKLDRGQALAAVCKEWERAHKNKEG
jgi:hypothetical protein